MSDLLPLKPIAVSSFRMLYEFVFETQVNKLNCEQVAAGYNGMIVEIAQLRATVAAQAEQLRQTQERIAWLTSDIGEDGLAAINRLIAACNRGDIGQQYTPDLSISRDEILRQAEQLREAHEMLDAILKNSREPDEGDCAYCNCEQGGGNKYDCYYDCPMNEVRAWLAANAPQEQQA